MFNKHLFDLCLIITCFLILCKFFSQRGGKFMKVTDLKKLIEKYGEVTFVEIIEELKELGYSCKIVGEVNA